MADALVLGTSVTVRAGSSPVTRTISSVHNGFKSGMSTRFLFGLNYGSFRMYGAGWLSCSFLSSAMRLCWNSSRDIFHCNALTGISCIITLESRIRYFNIANKAVIDNDTLSAALAFTLGFINVDMVY